MLITRKAVRKEDFRPSSISDLQLDLWFEKVVKPHNFVGLDWVCAKMPKDSIGACRSDCASST